MSGSDFACLNNSSNFLASTSCRFFLLKLGDGGPQVLDRSGLFLLFMENHGRSGRINLQRGAAARALDLDQPAFVLHTLDSSARGKERKGARRAKVEPAGTLMVIGVHTWVVTRIVRVR